MLVIVCFANEMRTPRDLQFWAQIYCKYPFFFRLGKATQGPLKEVGQSHWIANTYPQIETILLGHGPSLLRSAAVLPDLLVPGSRRHPRRTPRSPFHRKSSKKPEQTTNQLRKFQRGRPVEGALCRPRGESLKKLSIN